MPLIYVLAFFLSIPDTEMAQGIEIYPHGRQRHGLTLISAWISNYIHHREWDEITYSLLHFNGATVEV